MENREFEEIEIVSAEKNKDVEENKIIAVLCYFGLLILIPFLMRPNSKFVKYHTNQGVLLILFGVAINIIGIIPFIGWIVAGIGLIFSIIFWITGIVNVLKGEMKPLPLIGKYVLVKY